MVSPNRSACESDTVGTEENWGKKKVCWNPEIQSPEEMSNKDKLQGPAGNTFLKYGVVTGRGSRRSMSQDPLKWS